MLDSAGTTVEQVKENPLWYAGRQVTLAGEVDEVYSNRSFELEGNQGLFDSEVLVITKSDVSVGGRNLMDDDDVIVSGKVQRFIVGDVERDIGWDLPTEVETEWTNKAVVIADAVSRVDEYARWTDTGDEIVSMTAVYYYPDPASLAGSPVALESVPIREMSEKGIWIGDNEASQLYVALSDQQLKGLSKKDRVDVQGTVRSVPERSQLENEWKLDTEQADAVQFDAVYIEAKKVEKAASGEQASVKQP